jgi:hypothetical protein
MSLIRRSRMVASFLSALALASVAEAAPLTLTKVANEFTGGVGWISPDVRPAISPSGCVVFAGATPPGFPSTQPSLFVACPTKSGLAQVNLAGAGYSLPRAVQIDTSGRIVFDSTHTVRGTLVRGFYRTTPRGTIASIFESATQPASLQLFGLSPNGTIAFSTIVNGAGGVMRGVLPATPTVLRAGSGTFYNTKKLDVNDAGQVPIVMEYGDPTAGLTNGIPIFSGPGQSLSMIDAVLGRAGLGLNIEPSINASGVAAFAINGTLSLNFYSPPNVWSPTPALTITLQPGVYTADPAPFGEPSVFTQIANASGPYASFGKVSINSAGVVAFEATLDTPSKAGIFTGPDPVANKVVQQGDIQGSTLFAWIKMGELNDAGQLVLLADNFNSADYEVWRVAGLNP